MIQADRFSCRIPNRRYISGAAALLIFSAASADVLADSIVRTRTDILDHNVTQSAFFSSTVDGTAYAKTDENWGPKDTAKAGEAVSTTPSKTYIITGNSTSAGGWIDGTGVPAGLILTFTAEFTISALPLSGGSFLTNPGIGPTATPPADAHHGRGIGITQTLGGIDDIDKPDGIHVSAATISNVSFSGTLTEPGFTFTPGGISNFGTRVLRSGNFNETVAGMLLTQGEDTIGFGLSTGTLASNLNVANNFGSGADPSAIFDRRVGPYTLVVDGPTQTSNTAVIKGIGIAYEVMYDITAAPLEVPGDYNANGTVDAADYVLWREATPRPMVTAAPSSTRPITISGARFGNTSGAGAGSSLGQGGAVPEPTSLVLIGLGFVPFAWRRGLDARG